MTTVYHVMKETCLKVTFMDQDISVYLQQPFLIAVFAGMKQHGRSIYAHYY